jgi:hypothetical protein
VKKNNMAQSIRERDLFFQEGIPSVISKAYSLACQYLDKPSPINPYDTLIDHSQRVALALNSLLPSDYPQRDSIVAAGLIYELNDPRHEIKLIDDYVDLKSVWLTVLGEENASLSFLERKAAMLRKIPYIGGRLANESVLVLAVNEIDKLQMLFDYYKQLQDLFGGHADDIFLGSFPDGYSNNCLFYRDLLLPKVKKWLSDEPDWQSVIDDLECKVGELKAISPPKETELTNIDQAISSELRESLTKLCQFQLPASFVGDFSVVPGRQISEERAVFLSDGMATLDDMDFVFYSLAGGPVEIEENVMKKIAILMADQISIFALSHNIRWENRLRWHVIDRSKKEKLITFNFVGALPHFAHYDFGLKDGRCFDPEETFAKIIEFTVMLGNVANHQVIGYWEIEEWRAKNLREEITALAKRVISGEKHMGAHLELIVDSHLFLPYCLPTIIKILNSVGLGSDEGIRSLIIEALINVQAHINQSLIETVLKRTPQGLFNSREEANEFLYYLADNLRESFGKTQATESAFNKRGQWRDLQAVLTGDGNKADQVLTGLEHWFRLRVRDQSPYRSADENGYRKRMERNDKYISLIYSAFD